MSTWLKTVEANGIYDRFDLTQDFDAGVNILHGKNGTGKTTLLHIIANILNGDFKRFAYLNFRSVKAVLDDDETIQVTRYETASNAMDTTIVVLRNSEEIDEIPVSAGAKRTGLHSGRPVAEAEPLTAVLPAAYFPAFRTMIEAWVSMKPELSLRHGRYVETGPESVVWESDTPRVRETALARELFGDFVPRINYPSPQQISERLRSEIQQAIITISQTDRKVLSEAFVKTFAALTSSSEGELNREEILDEIKTLTQKLEQPSPLTAHSLFFDAYVEVRGMVPSVRLRETETVAVRILDLYRKSLKEMVEVQDTSFEVISRYVDSVNEFLSGKELTFETKPRTRKRPSIAIRFDDGTFSSLRALSSGERQIVTLLYAATHMSREQVVLIDEPEISLHVDWQRLLLKKMAEQLGQRQIIACTHSPVIGAEFFDRLRELELKSTRRPASAVEKDQDEEIGNG